MKRYFRTIGTSLTECLGAVVGITLNSNETTSGAAYRKNITWLQTLIDSLFFWQEDHCAKATVREIEDCKELLLAYEFTIEPPQKTKETVVTGVVTKAWVAQAPAREEEATLDDPESDTFDAEAWFAALPDNAKARIVEWGVSIKMSVDNRKKVGRLARVWWGADVVPRKNHGMTE